MWVERIGQPARTPWSLAFDPEVLIILRGTLQASLPYEGCALLLGSRQKWGWRVHTVWPCCNIWRPGMEALPEPFVAAADVSPTPSRLNRFAIDPREQLHAQRWARDRRIEVIGSAHSHPQGQAVPSSVDCGWIRNSSLMVIQGADQDLRAWWLEPGDSLGVVTVEDTDCSERHNRSAR